MQDDSREKIVALQRKVKQLQKQISQRVRNFLLQNNRKSSPVHTITVSRQIQTDIITPPVIDIITPQRDFKQNLLQQSSVSYIQSCQSPQRFVKNKDYYQLPISFDSDPMLRNKNTIQQLSLNKQMLSRLLQKLIEKHQKFQKSHVSQTQQDIVQSNEENIIDFYKRQRKKMRRQIRKLKASLQFQNTICLHAKQGLMLSEQQNYRFRIRILQLLAIIENSKKHNLQESDQQNCHYLQSIINNTQIETQKSRKDQINCQLLKLKFNQCCNSNQLEINLQQCKINVQNQSGIVESQINRLQNCLQQLRMQKDKLGIDIVVANNLCKQSIEVQMSFMEIIKDKVYIISNLIPIRDNSKQFNLFRPQNQDQILQVLERVEEYFKQVDKWQNTIQEEINHKKSFFVQIIKNINSLIDNSVRRKIKQELKVITKMKQYIGIFRQSQQQKFN